MKNTFLAFLMITTFSCKSQTPVLPRYDTVGNYGEVEGAYYKDINDFHEQFVGTWLYTNGTTSLKVVLRKKNMHHKTKLNTTFYADYLVGEYQYIENGVQKVNTLANITMDYENIFDYNLRGIVIINNESEPICYDCLPGAKRLLMDFQEPNRDPVLGPSAEFIIRVEVEGGVTKLKVQYYSTGSAIVADTPEVKYFSLQPYGDYTLIKQ